MAKYTPATGTRFQRLLSVSLTPSRRKRCSFMEDLAGVAIIFAAAWAALLLLGG